MSDLPRLRRYTSGGRNVLRELERANVVCELKAKRLELAAKRRARRRSDTGLLDIQLLGVELDDAHRLCHGDLYLAHAIKRKGIQVGLELEIVMRWLHRGAAVEREEGAGAGVTSVGVG